MTVRVSPLNILGTVGVASNAQVGNFKDTFQRANGATWGPAWIDHFWTCTSAGNCANASINSNLGVITSVAAQTTAKLLMPAPLVWISQRVQNQFSELTISSITTAFGIGPTVVTGLAPGSASGVGPLTQGLYLLEWNNTNLQIIRFVYNGTNNNGAVSVVLNTAAVTIAPGDVLRLEATNSGGTWTLNGKKNGTVVITTTDTALVQGMPGLYCALSSASAITANLSEYAGGSL